MLSLRKATIDDYEAVENLKKQVHSLHVKAYPKFYKEINLLSTKEEFAKELGDNSVDIYVLAEHGNILGYASINTMIIENHPTIIDQRMFFIEEICIDESYRGKGYGKELFNRLEELARGNGFTSIELNVWGFNEIAKVFYEKMGMECNRVRMSKTL
jgi:Acetyltransferases